MQLTITRNERNGRYDFEAVVDLTIEERRTIARHNLQDFVVANGMTIGDMELGKRGEFRTLGELLNAETQFREACTKLRAVLEATGSLDGKKIVLKYGEHTPDMAAAGECPDWLVPLFDPFATKAAVTTFFLVALLSAALDVFVVTFVSPDLKVLAATAFIALPIALAVWAKILRFV